ncbi:hypothetical protein SAMN05444365_10761 [Micromonospora pattaloongensis]|uniref:Uncharacterized protein n=1 Tax=Micromonospora pattaloongensis TaxID=405436 RepID=A0A1H3R4Y2_9ACTN|nr:hypothetical protein [Micromonospora pattaloongensis]SDZ20710.1 hypothetical protein SAMN05444365_10761 [Micromonospora pattaloongensis]
MKTQQVKERATKAAGTLAGTAADPKTGWSHLKSKVTPSLAVVIGGALVAVYLAGRRAGGD